MLHQWGHSGATLIWVLGVTIRLCLIVAIGVYLVYLIHGMKLFSHICCPTMGFPSLNNRSSKIFFFSCLQYYYWSKLLSSLYFSVMVVGLMKKLCWLSCSLPICLFIFSMPLAEEPKRVWDGGC